jgi:hypothetical protein
MIDYTAMDAGELYHALGGDGHKWAEAFLQYNPHCDVAQDAAVAWFCNAVMAGHDAALGNPPLNGDHAQWLMDREGNAP